LARAFSIVNIHLVRQRAAFRSRSQAAISGFEALPGSDPAVEALAAEHADFDRDHVQSAGVLEHIVELQSLQHTARFARRESLVERTGRMGR
jgi:hypothetical protein